VISWSSLQPFLVLFSKSALTNSNTYSARKSAKSAYPQANRRSRANGHPIGATGAVVTTRLIHSMRRDGLKRGLDALCIDGGQGIALALETIAYSKPIAFDRAIMEIMQAAKLKKIGVFSAIAKWPSRAWFWRPRRAMATVAAVLL